MLEWLARLWRVKRSLGERGERAAASYLRQRGFKILSRQLRNRIGEIDLIAQEGESIVFVEVKTRRSNAFGTPAEAVTHQKQAQLTRAALCYLKQNGLMEGSSRFDVVAVLWPAEYRSPEITHYRNAFPFLGDG